MTWLFYYFLKLYFQLLLRHSVFGDELGFNWEKRAGSKRHIQLIRNQAAKYCHTHFYFQIRLLEAASVWSEIQTQSILWNCMKLEMISLLFFLFSFCFLLLCLFLFYITRAWIPFFLDSKVMLLSYFPLKYFFYTFTIIIPHIGNHSFSSALWAAGFHVD